VRKTDTARSTPPPASLHAVAGALAFLSTKFSNRRSRRPAGCGFPPYPQNRSSLTRSPPSYPPNRNPPPFGDALGPIVRDIERRRLN
jgi:hypothetical protein